MPSKQAFEKAVQLVLGGNTEEAAQHLCNKTAEVLKACDKEQEGQPLMAKINEVLRYIQMRLRSVEDIWKGKTDFATDFESFQASVAEEAHAILEDLLGKAEIVYNYAINKESNLVRGYTSSDRNQTLDEASTKALDDLLNAWLAKNQMRNKDGFIYHADRNGEIRQIQTKGGKSMPEKVDPRDFAKRFNDSKTGFAAFVKSKNENIKLTTKEQPYPEKQVTKEQVGRGAKG